MQASLHGQANLKIVIGDPGSLPELVHAVAMKARQRRLAVDVVVQRQEEFLVRWREIHGDEP